MAWAFTREVIAHFIYPEGRRCRNLLERAANTCPLTGLANRRSFDLAQPAAETDARLSFIVFDANNFKLANDALGHLFGDNLLKLIAKAITDAAGQFGYQTRVWRYAGDEFVIVCPTRIAAIIRDDAEKFFGNHHIEGGVFASVSGEIGSTFDEADSRLQKHKQDRKNNQQLKLVKAQN